MPIDSGNLALKGLDDLFSTEEKRQEEQREQVQQIPIDALHPFTNHPFKVLDDEAMTRTVESIAQYGVLAPLIARPRPDGDGYEIISGHRRQYAAKLAGLDTLPVIVRHKAVHRYFQLESEKEMIEEEYHFYMGQAQMISYGAMLGKIKKAILGKDDGDTQKLLELLLDTWIDEVEEQLKENIAYQGMLEKISKYEEQVQTMGLAKEKRKTIDAYVTEVNERWMLYAESLYQVGMQKILELLNL